MGLGPNGAKLPALACFAKFAVRSAGPQRPAEVDVQGLRDSPGRGAAKSVLQVAGTRSVRQNSPPVTNWWAPILRLLIGWLGLRLAPPGDPAHPQQRYRACCVTWAGSGAPSGRVGLPSDSDESGGHSLRQCSCLRNGVPVDSDSMARASGQPPEVSPSGSRPGWPLWRLCASSGIGSWPNDSDMTRNLG